MLKTAIIGASGYIGRRLWESYRQSFPDCIGTAFANLGPGMTHFDIRRPDVAALRLEATGHQAVLIAAAKPNVAFCEREPAAAHTVNVSGTLELIRQIGRTSLPVIFLSSDYVFPGTTGRYDDDVPTNPTTEYGRQKVLVETEIPALVDNYLVVRLSKVYGLDKHDGTLLDEMGSSLASGREIPAAVDQLFCPTYVVDLARAIHTVQDRGLRGKLNLCSPQSWSRYEIADAMARAMNANASFVKKIGLHDLPSMKERPLNTTMVCSRLEKEAGPIAFTPLQESIKQAATNWTAALAHASG
jgi:dTDP-4-dehydrorhamnose reductase